MIVGARDQDTGPAISILLGKEKSFSLHGSTGGSPGNAVPAHGICVSLAVFFDNKKLTSATIPFGPAGREEAEDIDDLLPRERAEHFLGDREVVR